LHVRLMNCEDAICEFFCMFISDFSAELEQYIFIYLFYIFRRLRLKVDASSSAFERKMMDENERAMLFMLAIIIALLFTVPASVSTPALQYRLYACRRRRSETITGYATRGAA